MVLALLAMTGVLAGSAHAAGPVKANPKGKFLGVIGHHLPGAALPNAAATPSNLTYHNGPVMHSDKNIAIFWEPAGRATTANYKSVVRNYFTSVAAASGRADNVYATNTQYYDVVGGTQNNAAYNVTYGGSITDTQPYPASGCRSPNGHPCLIDSQITAEINRVITANGTPVGMGVVYYVFFPAAVDSCFDASAADCTFSTYCAYHSSFTRGGSTVLYANQPYAAVSGCDPNQRPNGDPADAVLNVVSHENNETITDPLGTAWYDGAGNENGDKCNFNFGAALGGASGASYNQGIGGYHYWLQQEWSNANNGCVQRMGSAPPPTDENPTASFTFSPSAATAGAPVAFDGAGSSDPDGSINTYSWNFGDGATATGQLPSHAYASGGVYTVTLQVTDSSGLTASTSRSVTVAAAPPPANDENPTASFTTSRYGGYVYFAGSGSDPDGSIRSYAWNFGDGTSSSTQSVWHAFPRSGSYTVTLTVLDSSGLTATATRVVTV